jgi:hypothetical protein
VGTDVSGEYTGTVFRVELYRFTNRLKFTNTLCGRLSLDPKRVVKVKKIGPSQWDKMDKKVKRKWFL